ncbi:MAG: GntR family transcriptional regulator [Thermomicrobiales bacterium]
MPIPPNLQREETDTPARELVLSHLRNWIVEGILAPGEIIKDTEIARTFDVSRTPVREALLQLRAEGLIETKPQGWTQVKPLDLGQVELLLPVVLNLEGLAARMAAENPDRDMRKLEQAQHELVNLIEEIGVPVSADRAGDVVAADDRFHAAVLAMANNIFLSGALQPLKMLMRRYERIHYGHMTVIDHESLAMHQQLLDAIRAGDAEKAEALITRNLMNSPLHQKTVQADAVPTPVTDA